MSNAYDQFTRAAIERRQRLKGLALQAMERQRVILVEEYSRDVEHDPEPVIAPVPLYRKNYPFVSDIVGLVSNYYRIDRDDILSQRRTKHIVDARHMIFWLCKVSTPLSYPAIGYWMGKRDHTTVLHGVRRIEKKIQGDVKFRLESETLRDRLRERNASHYYGA